ncbi:retron system putative HNH endonuclease, partial [Pararhodospirillum oryzae]|uniref:retron system putative HNH endonuclease n=1 Tax=Pararhodospirillum oryzae TaxID=478448 RepID=UPI0011BE2C9D
HIEHFYARGIDEDQVFVWENLFLSCEEKKHCGHYKDRSGHQTYDPSFLIKPDEENPEDFLFFHSSGEVRPRNNLTEDDRRRAEETIRVFGLNAPVLKGKRAQAAKGFRKSLEQDLDTLASWPEEERRDYLYSEIEARRGEPYATTLKHCLLGNGGSGPAGHHPPKTPRFETRPNTRPQLKAGGVVVRDQCRRSRPRRLRAKSVAVKGRKSSAPSPTPT